MTHAGSEIYRSPEIEHFLERGEYVQRDNQQARNPKQAGAYPIYEARTRVHA